MLCESILRIQQMRWGNYILFISFIITLNSFLLFLSSILQPTYSIDHSRRSLLSVNLITSISETSSAIVNKFYEDNIGKIPLSKTNELFNQPIDVVYTWVNGSDPEHIKAIKKAKAYDNKHEETNFEDDGKNRFEDHNELLYSLRSVYQYAPWIRRIYLVTNGQLPSWLNIYHPNLHIVTHSAIFTNQSHLPCFSSPAIEANLHNIPGLANYFIYLNDDTMFGSDIHLSDFITPGGGQKVFYSWGVPDCNDGCPSNWLGDGFCDNACNVATCNFDNGDCSKDNNNNISPSPLNHDNQKLNTYCSLGCFEGWIGDNYCDRSCKTPECGMDGGDCGIEEVVLKLKGFNLEKNMSNINIPDEVSLNSLYINMSDVIGTSKIQSAVFSDSNIIKTSVIKRNSNMLILILNRNITREDVEFRIKLDDSDLIFNISLTTLYQFKVNSSNSDNQTNLDSNSNSIPIKDTSGIESDTPTTKSSNDNNSTPVVSSQSKKVDTYAESLRYVNSLLNKEFGSAQRYVPAHMPHFLQKDVLIRMHQFWKHEFEKTSSNRFRSTDDMQFALSYFYFLMNEKKNYSIDDLFYNDWDINKDKVLDKYEIRALISKISDYTFNVSVKDIDDDMINDETSYDQMKEYFSIDYNSTFGKFTLDQIKNMTKLMDKINNYYKRQPNNKFEIVEDSKDVGFVMIKTNKTKTTKKFDNILSLRHKFLCLNDDLNYSDPHSEEVIYELKEFLNIMYPNPSPFEVENGSINPYNHVDQLIEAKNRIYRKKLIIYFAICIIIAIILCTITFYPKSQINFKYE